MQTATTCEPRLSFQGRSISLVCPYQKGIDHIFCDMITRGLIPGRELEVEEFLMQKRGEELYLSLVLEMTEDLVPLIEQRLPSLEAEILLGIESPYHAKKMLEMVGEKQELLQEKLRSLLIRFPQLFHFDLLEEVHPFLYKTTEAFRANRSAHHLAWMIATLYGYRQRMEDSSERQLALKVRKGEVQTPFGPKMVFCVYGAFRFLSPSEHFEKKHLFASLPEGTIADETTYFGFTRNRIHCFYVEVKGGECSRLKRLLPEEIEARIERLVHPVFMPRNEEEVMRNILTLSKQLRMVGDLPQVMISFEKQLERKLSFTVIVVRQLMEASAAVESLLENSPLVLEKKKQVGMLRKKIPKEAAVCRVEIPLAKHLRKDFSVDFLQARKAVVQEVEQIFGPVRDFNGGMIAKQRENFLALQRLLEGKGQTHLLTLQNFFYALSPAQFSATLDPKMLQKLFMLFLATLKTGKAQEFRKDGFHYIVGITKKPLEGALVRFTQGDFHGGILTFEENRSY